MNNIKHTGSVQFWYTNQGIQVNISTENLYLRRVEQSDVEYENYIDLFKNKGAISKFSISSPLNEAEIRSLIDNIWVQNWKNNNPYSTFTVLEKNTGSFVGCISLACRKTPGIVELSGLCFPKYYRKGYADEATQVILRKYIPVTKENGYLVEGKPVDTITVRANASNTGALKVVKKIGMMNTRISIKEIGVMQRHYSLSLD